MRILHTVQHYWPSVGGAEIVVQRLSEGLVELGHDVTVATSGSKRSTEVVGRVSIERFPVAGAEATGITGAAHDYVDFVRNHPFDILMNYAAQTWSTDLVLDLDLDRPRVIAPCGYSGLQWPAFRSYFERLPGRLRRYDALVYHSSRYRDAEFGRQHGLTNSTVIPNGADDVLAGRSNAQSLHERLGLTDEAPVIVTVGTHTRSKGHSQARAAFSRIGSRHHEARLIIVGAQPGLRASLRRGNCYLRCLASAAARPRVHVLDGRDRATVLDTLADASLFLFASQIECAPLVILEAMSAGCPWVSLDVGNVRDLAGGVVVDSVDELADVASALLAAPEERAALGDLGRTEWNRAHRWPTIVGRYEDLYLGLAA